jgi:hypothetical protein
MNGDARGWRIALLPEALVNPPEACLSGYDLPVEERRRWRI